MTAIDIDATIAALSEENEKLRKELAAERALNHAQLTHGDGFIFAPSTFADRVSPERWLPQ